MGLSKARGASIGGEVSVLAVSDGGLFPPSLLATPFGQCQKVFVA